MLLVPAIGEGPAVSAIGEGPAVSVVATQDVADGTG